MSFDLSHRRKWSLATPAPRAVSPQAAHEYQLLAAVASCKNLLDFEIAEIFGFDPDYAYRLYRSTPGRAFDDWIKSQPDELREHHRLKEDFLTPLEDATSAGPSHPEIIEEPTPVDDPLERYLHGDSPTEPTPDE